MTFVYLEKKKKKKKKKKITHFDKKTMAGYFMTRRYEIIAHHDQDV